MENARTHSQQFDKLIATMAIVVNSTLIELMKDFPQYLNSLTRVQREEAQPSYTQLEKIIEHGITSGTDFAAIFIRSIPKLLKKAKRPFTKEKIAESKRKIARKIELGLDDEVFIHGCPGSQMIVPIFRHIRALFEKYAMPHIDEIFKLNGGVVS